MESTYLNLSFMTSSIHIFYIIYSFQPRESPWSDPLQYLISSSSNTVSFRIKSSYCNFYNSFFNLLLFLSIFLQLNLAFTCKLRVPLLSYFDGIIFVIFSNLFTSFFSDNKDAYSPIQSKIVDDVLGDFGELPNL